MTLIMSSSSPVVYPCLIKQIKLPMYGLGLKTTAARSSTTLACIQCNIQHCVDSGQCYTYRKNPLGGSGLTARNSNKGNVITEESKIGSDWEDQIFLEEGDEGSPWEGTIVYKRNPSISHIEYCTSLERLGLGKLSTVNSKMRASVMGLRITKARKNDYPDGTPVMVSIDITRKKRRLRLDGIIRTVITLCCNRCGEPAVEVVFSNFTLLLSEEPIDEPETINMGTIFGEGGCRTFGIGEEEEEVDDGFVDLDDQLYFPPEEKVIDISKQIRDLIHVEITINALCDPMCKGLCLKCGTNLNVGSCSCRTQQMEEKRYGPLGSLRKQMQRN